MTATLTEIGGQPIVPHSAGDVWEIRSGVTLSGTYKTGGDATLWEVLEKVLLEQGMGEILWIDIQGGTGGYILQINYAEKKLMVFRTGAALKGALEQLPEEAYPAALTSAALRVFCIGR